MMMGKKKAEAAPVAVMEISPAAQAVKDLVNTARDAGAASATAEGGFKAAGALLKAANFIPSDERTKGSDSAALKEQVRAAYFEGYGAGKNPQERAWLATNSVKGLPDSEKEAAHLVLIAARSAFGNFWSRAKKSAGLVPVEAGQPVGGAVAAGEPGDEEAVDMSAATKEQCAAILADGDLALAEWLLWAASKEGRGHLKATYSANVKP